MSRRCFCRAIDRKEKRSSILTLLTIDDCYYKSVRKALYMYTVEEPCDHVLADPPCMYFEHGSHVIPGARKRRFCKGSFICCSWRESQLVALFVVITISCRCSLGSDSGGTAKYLRSITEFEPHKKTPTARDPFPTVKWHQFRRKQQALQSFESQVI